MDEPASQSKYYKHFLKQDNDKQICYSLAAYSVPSTVFKSEQSLLVLNLPLSICSDIAISSHFITKNLKLREAEELMQSHS